MAALASTAVLAPANQLPTNQLSEGLEGTDDMKRLGALSLLALSIAVPAAADEGMWPFDNVPVQAIEEKYGFAPDQGWLDHLRLSSARLAGGCSASFVSPNGLVLTNHHCVHHCAEQLSTRERDLVKDGFLAKAPKEELSCPGAEINQLLSITDVTETLEAATKGRSGKEFVEAQRGAKATLEKECSKDRGTRCDVVTLYNGGKFHLYKYRRFQDVRLVWVPELDAAAFGGDPDNFNFPRYDLDAAFLRVYDGGEPAKTKSFLRWSKEGAKPGELSLTSGHPGRTQRLLSVSELELQRDLILPERLLLLAELRGILSEFQRRGPEQRRMALGRLSGIENSMKVMKGMRRALGDPSFFARKVEEERALREWVSADPKRVEEFAAAWEGIEEAQLAFRQNALEYFFIESSGRGWGLQSSLYDYASTLVRLADERAKPNELRLREFNEANLPAVEQRLRSNAPIYPELEIALFAFGIEKMRGELGTDHPFVKLLLGDESPQSLAERVIGGTTLADPMARVGFLEGGRDAIASSEDPMIELARRLDEYSRSLRIKYEEEVSAPQSKHNQLLAKARFAAYGTKIAPDATFTLRLSFGAVEGWTEGDVSVAPITVLGGMYERATGAPPYALPPRWLELKDTLDLETPMNFVSTNDIVGGNSGSPVVNKDLEVIGLVFDGNLPSLGGAFAFDPAVNRAVSVHSRVIVESLRKIYRADWLLEELGLGQAQDVSSGP